MLKKTTEKYLQQLIDLEIPYTLIGEYITNDTPIEHECLNGHIWLARPSNILNGRGCPVCSGKKKKTTEIYQAELDSLGKGYVCLEPYINNKTKVKHRCKNGHEWDAIPKDLVGSKKTNCPYCTSRYIDYDDIAYLYYIRIETETFPRYKIGITKNSLEERYKGSDLTKITCLLWKKYDKGWQAAEQEKKILEEFREYAFRDSSLLQRGGQGSEIFSMDILQLDKV